MANASGATEFVDAVTADQYIDEIWSKYVIRAREQKLVFARLCTRKYEDDLSHGDTIHVPQVAHLTSRTKHISANTAVTFETDTSTHVNITIGTWEYVAMAVETATSKQSYKDLIQLYAPEMGYALALGVDDALAALVDDFATNIVGTLGALPTFEQFLEARRLLNDANVPRRGRAGVFSPAAEEGFLQLDQFIRNDYSKIQGAKDDDDDMGFVGSWFGIPIYVSTNVEGDNTAGHDNTILHSEALACCMQMQPTSHRWFDINYLADKRVTEQLYGVKEMRDDHGCWFRAA